MTISPDPRDLTGQLPKSPGLTAEATGADLVPSGHDLAGYPAWFALGEDLLARRAYSDALVAFKRALELAPGRREPYFYLGVVSDTLNRLAEASRYYAEALKLSPEWPEALYNAAHVKLRLGDLEDARSMLENLLAKRSDFTAAWLNLGSVHACEDNWHSALQCWREATRRPPIII